jgi:hypothetical protein
VLAVIVVLGTLVGDPSPPAADSGARDAVTDGVAPDAGPGDGGAADVGAGLGAVDAGAPAGAAPEPARVHLRGVVFVKGTRDRLGGAAVTVDATPVGETGTDGSFDVPVAPGRRRLQVQFPGYEPSDMPVEAAAGMPDVTVRLMPRLTGERYESVVAAPTEGARVALDQDELTHTPGSLGEPLRVIESLPGVTQAVWPLPLYAIRGANPGNTGFFLDGVRMPALFHVALGPAVIHPFFIDHLEFFPGGYPARFGRYVSGVVAASTAPPKPDHLRAEADVRLFDMGGIVATPFDDGKGAVAVAGRFSYTGLIYSLLSPDYTLGYWDYQARVDHTLGSGRLTVFAFGAYDHLGHKTDSTFTGTLHFHRVDTRWEGAVGPGRLLAGTALGYDHSEVQIPPVIPVLVSSSSLNAAPRLSYLLLGPRADFEVGTDAEVQHFSPQSKRPDASTEDLFRGRLAVTAAGYGAVTVRPTRDLALTLGMREELFAESGAHSWEPEPRLSLRFRPFGRTWIKATAGRFAQMASLPAAIPGFEGFGLSTLGTQTSKQGSIGIEQAIGDTYGLELTGFYQRLRLTDLNDMFNYDLADKRLLELRDGESYGAEVMIRRAQSQRLYGWLAYTLSWSQRLIGAARAKAYSDWDQRHVLNVVAGYRFRHGYTLGARFHLNTGRPYPIYDTRSSNPPEYVRLPAFYQIDLRLDKRMVFDRYTLDLYIEAVNATATSEVFNITRNMSGRIEETAFRIVLPSIGVHAEW